MCTAITYKTKDFYFGRTLDNDCSFDEKVTVTPRNFRFEFCEKEHFSIIGTSHIEDGYPLYYDAVNEKGLCIAALNFTGNAKYNEVKNDKMNIAYYDLISFLLCRCETVDNCERLLKEINIISASFRDNLPEAELHWLIADKERSITVEAVSEGLKTYENPVGILTNNPTFDKQLFSLNNYMALSPKAPINGFSDKISFDKYSRGMGGIGLPGDLSSQSRFVRASFVKMNSVSGQSEEESVGQFFHIMNSVEQQKGCCLLENGEYETTIYTSCCNADKGIYYYSTYGNRQITAINMHNENLDSEEVICYNLIQKEQIRFEN